MSVFDTKCDCGSCNTEYFNDTGHVTHIYKIREGEFVGSKTKLETKGYRNTKLECSRCGKVIFENSLTLLA